MQFQETHTTLHCLKPSRIRIIIYCEILLQVSLTEKAEALIKRIRCFDGFVFVMIFRVGTCDGDDELAYVLKFSDVDLMIDLQRSVRSSSRKIDHCRSFKRSIFDRRSVFSSVIAFFQDVWKKVTKPKKQKVLSRFLQTT